MNISIRRILVPTDFSPPSKKAVEYGIAMAEKFSAELHVIHIVDDPTLPTRGSRYSWAVPDDYVPKLVHSAELELALAVPRPALASIDQRLVRAVKVGSSVNEILKYMTQNEIDLTVLGTHGRSGVSHLLLGSVAEKIVRLAICPVLTVHPEQSLGRAGLN